MNCSFGAAEAPWEVTSILDKILKKTKDVFLQVDNR